MKSFGLLRLLLLLFAFVAAPACGGAVGARPVHTEARVDHQVLVIVHRVDGNIFKFSVENLSDQPMVVDRDAITLFTPAGSQKREPGGIGATYSIAAGAAHDVNVKFSLSGLEPGTTVSVDFSKAIRIAGAPVAVDAIPFTIP